MLRLYSIAEWIAFLCSILLFAKGVRKEYKIFFFYTLIVVIVEYFGRRMAIGLRIPNHLLFTFACFAFSCFYLFTIRSFLTSQSHRKLAGLFIKVFVLLYFLNIFFIQRLTEFNSYSFIFAYILLAICCTFFYIEFINKEVITPFWKEPHFFIVSGYFIYGILTALIYTLHRYFAYLKIEDTNYRAAFVKTIDIANTFLYVLLAVAFTIIWKQRRS